MQAFQRVRGLPTHGNVDDLTWSTLLEAGWQLGSRLLYVSRPHLRGDDVATLQETLAQLGFDPVRVDGIFGPQTEHALCEFQSNVGLPSDGTLTMATLNQLRRLSGISTGRRLISEARSANGLDVGTFTRTLIVHGSSPLASELITNVPYVTTVIHVDGDDAEAAKTANQFRAALLLSFRERPEIVGIYLHYWQSNRSHSVTGKRLAETLAASFDTVPGVQPVVITGLSLPLLRETQMATLQIEYGDLGADAFSAVTRVLRAAIGDVFHNESTGLNL